MTMLIFIIAKVVFMLYNSSQVYSGHDILTVLWNGLSLDFSTSLYIIIVPFLVCAVSIWLGGIKHNSTSLLFTYSYCNDSGVRSRYEFI